MKIAFPTDDGKTISAHLGQAPYFEVAEYDDNREPRFEQREKPYHGGEHHHEGESHMSHAQSMLQPVEDCQVLISGGMGQPVYDQALRQGLQVILTGEKDIQAALQAFREGRLASDDRRIHMHH